MLLKQVNRCIERSSENQCRGAGNGTCFSSSGMTTPSLDYSLENGKLTLILRFDMAYETLKQCLAGNHDGTTSCNHNTEAAEAGELP